MRKLKVGLYGSNGHQVAEQLDAMEAVELVAVCDAALNRVSQTMAHPALYDRYDEFLKHPDMDVVSICSPYRRGQYEDVKAAICAGKHVYAEKPLVMDEAQLDALIRLANLKHRLFREMSPTSYESPYREIGDTVASGVIGQVVQVFVQKSYPYAPWRPQSEDLDGGLILQVGIHAVRLVEQVARRRVLSISAVHTSSGNPVENGELNMAASFQMRLEDGAIGSAILNYLNAAGSGVWGNDEMRIFGTKGYIESLGGDRRVNLVGHDGRQPLHMEPRTRPSHFEMFVQEILGQPTDLLPLETELRPLRVVLNARQSALHDGKSYQVSTTDV